MATSYMTRAGHVRDEMTYKSALEVILEALDPIRNDGSHAEDGYIGKVDESVETMTAFLDAMGDELDERYDTPSAYDALFQYHAECDISEMTPKYSWLHALALALMAAESTLPELGDGEDEESAYDDDAWIVVHASEILRYLAAKHGDAIGAAFAIATLDEAR